jgi:hypothetical protein
MSSIDPAQNHFVQQYVVPPVAAGMAIVPAFYGLSVKSALQLGKPRPAFHFFEVLKNGSKAAPTVGGIVGSQLVLQNYVEAKCFGKKKLNKQEKAVSTVATAFLTSPFLACLNGQTMGKTVWASLMSVRVNQVLTITGRETFFLGGLAANEYVAEYINKFRDNKDNLTQSNNTLVEYGSAYASGVIGSACGHACDTTLTRYQNNQPLTFHVRELLKGMGWRAFAGVGVFNLSYTFITKKVKSFSD